MADHEFCPLIKKNCVKDECKFYVHVRGHNPQTNAEMDMRDCAVRWLPVLILETNKETRQAAAAAESARNEFAKGALATHDALREAAGEIRQSLGHRPVGRLLEGKWG